eukprot:scaffold843_cov327-Prasinococcus_capsulatus_cf.AAC.3
MRRYAMRCDAMRCGARRGAPRATAAQPPRNRRAMPWRGERRHAAYLRRLSSAALRGSCGRAHAARPPILQDLTTKSTQTPEKTQTLTSIVGNKGEGFSRAIVGLAIRSCNIVSLPRGHRNRPAAACDVRSAAQHIVGRCSHSVNLEDKDYSQGSALGRII